MNKNYTIKIGTGYDAREFQFDDIKMAVQTSLAHGGSCIYANRGSRYTHTGHHKDGKYWTGWKCSTGMCAFVGPEEPDLVEIGAVDYTA